MPVSPSESRPERVIIAALAEPNRVIGREGKMPWHLPDDLKRFRRLTTGHPIIMGRTTWEESLEGRSLPQRHSIVVSTTLPPHPVRTWDDGTTSFCIVPSLDAAFAQTQSAPAVYIIGGASIYRQTLHDADRLELTLVERAVEGDATFPPYRDLVQQSFELVNREDHEGFRFETYQRRSP